MTVLGVESELDSYIIDSNTIFMSPDSKKEDYIMGSSFFKIRTGFNFLDPKKVKINDRKLVERFSPIKDKKSKLFGKR